ncbi:MAG: TetR/AcrR family transcriptional regulator [Ignavibacteria bacterium]
MTAKTKSLDKNTEQRILNSAKKIFHKKGLGGARMQEIADDAGINKAMLHYYFRSKEKLFDAVFEEALKKFLPKVKELLNVELPLFRKIEYFVEHYISHLHENAHVPFFIIYEINQNPGKFSKYLIKKTDLSPVVFMNQINEAIAKKTIDSIDPRQLMVNMVSMCIFPFLWKPIIMKIFGMTEKNFNEFIQSRKKEIPRFIINSIKKKK